MILVGPLMHAVTEPAYATDWKKEMPSHPEENGLRLEVKARMAHAYGSTPEGASIWKESQIFFQIALLNISDAPITVPTSDFGKPLTVPNNNQRGDVNLRIGPPKFEGKTTVFADASFAPVTLAPGERALLLSGIQIITNRNFADSANEVSVWFSVSKDFTGLRPWWTGALRVYQEIEPHESPDQELEKLKIVAQRPQMVPEMTTKLSALVRSADRLVIISHQGKNAVKQVVEGISWRQPLADLLGGIAYEPQGHLFAVSNRELEFYRGDKRVLFLEMLPWNSLRLYAEEFGGDYVVSADVGPKIIGLVPDITK